MLAVAVSAAFILTDKVLLNLVFLQMPGNNQRGSPMLFVCCVIVVLTDIIACVSVKTKAVRLFFYSSVIFEGQQKPVQITDYMFELKTRNHTDIFSWVLAHLLSKCFSFLITNYFFSSVALAFMSDCLPFYCQKKLSLMKHKLLLWLQQFF